MPKLVCPKLVYWCQKHPVLTPDHRKCKYQRSLHQPKYVSFFSYSVTNIYSFNDISWKRWPLSDLGYFLVFLIHCLFWRKGFLNKDNCAELPIIIKINLTFFSSSVTFHLNAFLHLNTRLLSKWKWYNNQI